MKSISEFLNFFSPIFASQPSFSNFKRLILGFSGMSGGRAVTEINDSKNWHKHFSSIYDFFKKAKWSHEQLSQVLFQWFLYYLNTQPRPILCIDDTKNNKIHANHIPGICWHADHHKRVKTNVKTEEGKELTATAVVGYKGHCWVVLAALHRLSPGKWCALPFKASLFVRQKYAGETFKTKHQLALSMLEKIYSPKIPLLVGDNFYGAKNFVNQLNMPVLSLLKSTAVGYEPAQTSHKRGRGRPKKYGRKVKLREELDQPERLRLHKVEVYGQTEFVEVASFEGLLNGHEKPVRVILVKGLRKTDFLLFTNDLSLSEEQMIEYYGARFQIEIAFRELKQEIGTFNYRLRSMKAILRYVHVSFVAYALVKFLAIQGQVQPQETAWYRPKGLASPRRVQQVIGQKLQAFRIFQGLAEDGYLRKNTLPEELYQFTAI